MSKTKVLLATWVLLIIGVSLLLPGCVSMKGNCPSNDRSWFHEQQGIKVYKQTKHTQLYTKNRM